MERKIAFITGASRGIGKATAMAMAEAGYNMVLTARTMKEGERHPHMLTTTDGEPLPGSLEETAQMVRSLGSEALTIRMDLMDISSIDSAIESTLAHWRQIDVLVNNATFQGAGLNVSLQDQNLDDVKRIFEANVFNPFHLTRKVAMHMVQRKGGVVISLTTGGAEYDPPMPVWKGGWGFGYGASKAAFHRLAGILNTELSEKGIRAFNLQPGVVTTEALMATLGENSKMAAAYGSAPPEVPAAAIRWLATEPEAVEFLGKTVHAQSLARKKGLVKGWTHVETA